MSVLTSRNDKEYNVEAWTLRPTVIQL